MKLYSIPPALTLCCFAGLAVLIILRGRRTKINILFFIICLLGSFLYIDILFAFNVRSAETALFISRLDHLFLVYIIPVYIHFFHEFLGLAKRKWLIRGAYMYSFFLMFLTPSPVYIASMQKHFFGFFAKGGVVYPLFGLGSLLATIYALLLICRAIRLEKHGVQKNRLKYVFAGFGVMGLMNGMNVLPTNGYAVYPPGNLSFIPLLVFAVGVFKHDLLDMGILIRKSLVYSLITAFLTFLYAFIVIAADRVFKGSDFSDSIYFPILFFFLIAFVFGPLKTATQKITDRLFFKGKYDYQKTIKNVSRMIVSVLDQGEISRQLLDTVVGAMMIDHGALFLRNPSGSAYILFTFRGRHCLSGDLKSVPKTAPFIDFMQKESRALRRKHLIDNASDARCRQVLSHMEALRAEIALPMRFKNALNGFILLGEKRSGDMYTKEDVDLLETLSRQSALAIENARSYQTIQDLIVRLEEKVEQRTRELKMALLETKRSQEQLVRSESLAAIGQLVAGVAHELNNPLASVTGMVQAALEDMEQRGGASPLDAELIDDLRFADRELGRAREIVASLLGLSRQTQTYTEPVNINTVVADALRVLRNQYKYLAIDIVENCSSDLPEIQGNFANLGQVVLNIVQNAIQAVADKNGKIHLTTRFRKDTGHVVFECKDNGPGIHESIRQDIFKPFFTTKEVGKGTGLGLYICHEIVRKHDGRLLLRETADGARFVIEFPVDIESPPAISSA